MSISAMQGAGTMPNMQEILEGWKSDPGQMLETLEDFNPDMAAKLTEEFDTDGNGELSDEEMAALQEKMVGMHEMMASMAAPPKPDDGQKPPSKEELLDGWQNDPEGMLEELSAANPELYQKLMDEFDANGDGELSEEELSAVQDRMIEVTESMPDMPPPPQGAMGMGGSGGALGEEEEEDETDLLGALLDAVGSSSDAADADENGIVTDQELADYLGVSLDDLDAIRSGQGQRADSQGGSDGGFGKDAMGRAIEAYLVNVEGGLADDALAAFAAGSLSATA